MESRRASTVSNHLLLTRIFFHSTTDHFFWNGGCYNQVLLQLPQASSVWEVRLESGKVSLSCLLEVLLSHLHLLCRSKTEPGRSGPLLLGTVMGYQGRVFIILQGRSPMLATASLTNRSWDNRLLCLCDCKITICYRAQIDKTFVCITAIDVGSVGICVFMAFSMSVSPTVYTATCYPRPADTSDSMRQSGTNARRSKEESVGADSQPYLIVNNMINIATSRVIPLLLVASRPAAPVSDCSRCASEFDRTTGEIPGLDFPVSLFRQMILHIYASYRSRI